MGQAHDPSSRALEADTRPSSSPQTPESIVETDIDKVANDALARNTNSKRKQWKIFLKINWGMVTRLPGQLASPD